MELQTSIHTVVYRCGPRSKCGTERPSPRAIVTGSTAKATTKKPKQLQYQPDMVRQDIDNEGKIAADRHRKMEEDLAKKRAQRMILEDIIQVRVVLITE